jgi:hypothetical protein
MEQIMSPLLSRLLSLILSDAPKPSSRRPRRRPGSRLRVEVLEDRTVPSAPSFGWVEGFPAYLGGSTSVAVDAGNNIYQAGGYGGTTNLGAVALIR